MDETTEIFLFLGIRNAKSIPLWKIAESGLRKSTLQRLLKRTKLPQHVILPYLDISEEDLKKDKEGSRFGITVSDRIIDLARLYVHGARTFEGVNNFIDWISTPLPTLTGKTPIDLLYSPHGLKFIDDIVLGIEHSILE